MPSINGEERKEEEEEEEERVGERGVTMKTSLTPTSRPSD